MPTFYVLRHGTYDKTREDKGITFDVFDSMPDLAVAWRATGGDMLQVDDCDEPVSAAAYARYGYGWGSDKVGHLSIEGFWMAKSLACPELLSFDDIFDRSEAWDFQTMNHRSGALQSEGKRVRDQYRHAREGFGVFCSVNLGQIGGPKHGANLAVHARSEVLDRVGMVPVDVNDSLGWSIIAHERGRALVILSHSLIIGSRWVAYIDPATIPGAVDAIASTGATR